MIALLGESRAGETQQQPAALNPFLDRCLFRWRIRTGIGVDENGDFAPQQIAGAAAPHFGKGPQRAFEIIVLAEQRLPGGVRRRCNTDRPPPPALVDKQYGAGRILAFNLDAGHPVAQLRR